MSTIFGAQAGFRRRTYTIPEPVMTPDLRARVRLFQLAALLGAGIGLFGLVVGSGVPIVDLVGRILNAPPPWPSAPGSSLFAFVPALLGAGAGALVKIALRGSLRA
jgi:hypothetical protein